LFNRTIGGENDMTRFLCNILDGVSSTIDLLPSQRPIRKISYLSRRYGSISDAMRKDWEMIGADLSRVIKDEKTRIDSEK
jgi:hypothetical protein